MTEPSLPEEGAADAPRRKGSKPRRHTVGKVILAVVLVLGLATGLGTVYFYRHLNGNLTKIDIASTLDNRPDKKKVEGPQEPLNILVMGSDTRDCEGCALDQESGAEASDTTILMHLSADRERAYGVSIPRDSLVDRPECTTESGEKVAGAADAMWNAAFTVGGPTCTVEQFEATTGVFVDHIVVVNFAGFEGMVNAIGGVPVCIPEDIVDPAHGINIPAGTREIEGREALNYVRARYTLGDGSDISRIKRQQAFIAAMAKKVVSAGTLARVDRLVGFLNAATKSLTVDEDLENVIDIARIGVGFQGIGLDNIKFLTVPIAYYPADSENAGRVYWTPPAKKLWEQVAADEPLSPRFTSDAIAAAGAPGGGGNGGGGNGGGGGGGRQPNPEDVARAEQDGLCA
ncbi:LCP family protein [Nocardioides euryhalodurans]|uniref:LytR family transcriptional regulator n=1 Tax=Nocardioides euryhalodurans TaxID=2518370 RepID=A0A4P7GKQ5_9ACTN|nr:LCP family protein [Nocardioides euryhalodurans]QBR92347.1 LytR family transcriptional regulator [Nocardioides euryhalodurans]